MAPRLRNLAVPTGVSVEGSISAPIVMGTATIGMASFTVEPFCETGMDMGTAVLLWSPVLYGA